MKRAVAAIMVLTAFVSGAHAQDSKAGEIAVFTKNNVDPFFEEARSGATLAAKSLGYSTVQYAPTRPNNFQEQIAQVEDAITRKPLGMIFVPVDRKGMKPSVDKVSGAGIPIINFIDRGEGNFTSYVVYDDHQIGFEVTTLLAEKLGGKGNVVIIEGVKGSTTSDGRVAGAKEALKKYPGITLLASQAANYQRLQALAVMENLMQQFPQIDGIIAASDNMALGAIEAMESAGRGGAQAVSMDGTIDGVQAVSAGRLLASSEFSGFQMGCSAVEIIDRLAKKEAVPESLVLKATIITKENAGNFGKPLEQRTCKQLAELGLGN
ncbi:sugar ABC transporter substrate-binding protein [Ensifer adhaerens]|nr:sugar ABC transporter substrate-binding protein [Ensifer adhaerens]UAY05049.1 sugar ABC transporter substrate-binding protein [Ensifer adhaerens]UAY12470.1 sugar ABC transporter substrate-binding protein [Ensifer adhaerens]